MYTSGIVVAYTQDSLTVHIEVLEVTSWVSLRVISDCL